ncbi:MAG TPA: hypothetical protein G4N92_07430 [Anaerolineae bacterium]|nr:hypothetical protein [Anaerolineae bacterium]
MKKVNFISAALESWWNWIVGGVFQVIGVVLFFRPDLSQVINWIGFISFLPPIAWVIIGVIVWIIGFAFNVRRQLNNGDKENKQKKYHQKQELEIHILRGKI